MLLFIFYHKPPLDPRSLSNVHAPAATIKRFNPRPTVTLTTPAADANATSCTTLWFNTPLASTAMYDMFLAASTSIPVTVAPEIVDVATYAYVPVFLLLAGYMSSIIVAIFVLVNPVTYQIKVTGSRLI
jgi:hypothetical protein